MDSPAHRYNVPEPRRGNSSDYGLRRLEHERPDLSARVHSGELSTHAAMVEAGFRKKTITLSTDPYRAAETLCKAYPLEGLRIIKRVLDREVLPAPDPVTGPAIPGGHTYYVVVDGEELSKHRKISLAFRVLEKLLGERAQQGEPPAQAWVCDERGRCYY